MTGTTATRPGDRWTAVIHGQQLRQLRRQQGLTQAELARKAAISLTVVTRAERQPGYPAGPAPWPASLPPSATCQPT